MSPYEHATLAVIHVLGAATWIGALLSILFGSIPYARRSGDLAAFKHVGKIVVGRIGLAALIVQILTGVRLTMWLLPSLGALFTQPSGTGHIILTKIVLLVCVFILGGYAYHKMLPKLSPEKLGFFTAMTWVLAITSILILIAGVVVRTGVV